MAFDFHTDTEAYFSFQYENARKYIIPFLQGAMTLNENTKVLEIGCAEAGVLKAFTDRGCLCTGIELNNNRLESARKFMKHELAAGKIHFIHRDIYDIDPENDLSHRFDLIILKDVIEHIPHQDRFMHRLRSFLAKEGKVFFGFPPWQMPFGGHQQICRSKFLSLLPYFHLLPMPVYTVILKAFGEPESVVSELQDIKRTGISIERFEQLCLQEKFNIVKKQFYLINPIYEYKFKIKTRPQLKFIAAIPVLRNFFTTAVYYLIE